MGIGEDKAIIQITAMAQQLGPTLPTEHHARIGQREWPGGQTVPILILGIGSDTIEVWPFDVDYVRALGAKLIALADKIETTKGG